MLRAFRAAPEIPFDDSSKIVMMSDCHRGDGSRADAFAGNQDLFCAALCDYYEKQYTYIELGDGDELWENERICDIISTYPTAFELLSRFYRSGRLYFLYGNHDMEKRKPGFYARKVVLFDEKEKRDVPLFPDINVYEGLTLRHTVTKDRIFLLHGHQADLLNGPLWRVSRFLVRYVWRPLELLGVGDPTSAAQNHRRKSTVERRLVRWAKKEKRMLIAGHTHRPVFPEPGAPLYFNDGSCVCPHSVTALEIKDGQISLVSWSNQSKSDGTVCVGRDVLAGPRKLSDYFGPVQAAPPPHAGVS